MAIQYAPVALQAMGGIGSTAVSWAESTKSRGPGVIEMRAASEGTSEYRELRLVEPLRAVRMLNHAAWVAERWTDPAFPRAFPWAAEPRFWEGYVGDLMQQCQALEEPPPLIGNL